MGSRKREKRCFWIDIFVLLLLFFPMYVLVAPLHNCNDRERHLLKKHIEKLEHSQGPQSSTLFSGKRLSESRCVMGLKPSTPKGKSSLKITASWD